MPDQITPAQNTHSAAPVITKPQTEVPKPVSVPTPTPTPQSVEQSANIPTPQHAVAPERRPAATVTQPTQRRSSLTGFSISSLMNNTISNKDESEETAKQQEQIYYDPATEHKINSQRDAVVASILEERPRFIVAFEKMQVKDHTIMLEVPSRTLYEEIMRSKTEILLQIARTAGITGSLELEIKVNEQIKASRPIKLEDRIKHMNDKNPHLAELKKMLDMEYE